MKEILHGDIHQFSKDKVSMALQAACALGNLDSIKNFLTSPDLKEHGDLNYDNGVALEFLFMNEHLHVFEYLIFDYKLEKTKVLERLMEIHQDAFSEKIQKMFQIRDVNVELTEELPSKNNDEKRLKI